MSPVAQLPGYTLRELDAEPAKRETEAWKKEPALPTTLQLLLSTQTLVPAQSALGASTTRARGGGGGGE